MHSLAIGAFILSVVAWLSCFPVSKVPSLRRTLWPTRMLFYVALILAFVAAPRNGDASASGWVIATFISFALFTVYNYVVLRMPRVPHAPDAGDEMPEIPLIGADGTTISLDSFRGKGPVLLIFFRGFW